MRVDQGFSLSSTFVKYCADIPKNTKQQVFYSFALGMACGTVFGDPMTGLVSGALSGIGAAVHALVTPLFKAITDRKDLYLAEEVTRTILSAAVAYKIVDLIGLPSHVTCVGAISAALVWSAIFVAFGVDRGSTEEAQIMFI